MKTLYETDFSAWLESQVQALKKKDFAQLDIEHLLEEMETLGTSEKNAIESHIVIILIHMIKIKMQLQPESFGTSWDDSIVNARVQIDIIIEKNPSLKKYPQQVFNRCYQRAVKKASKEMGFESREIQGLYRWSVHVVLGV
jgi:hypothetical protein